MSGLNRRQRVHGSASAKLRVNRLALRKARDGKRGARIGSSAQMERIGAGGVLLAVATPLHPSRETATTIIADEVRLVAAHALSTLSSLLVLLGLPGLYMAHRGGKGRLGLAGFLGAWSGTYLIAVSGNFGFLAPVLAKESPAVIDAILDYRPVVALNGLAVIGFVAGYALFGIAMTRTASLPGCPESSLPWAPPLTCSAPALRSSSHRPCGRSLFWAARVLGLEWPGRAIGCGRQGIPIGGHGRRALRLRGRLLVSASRSEHLPVGVSLATHSRSEI
jgi:hypothetical protein